VTEGDGDDAGWIADRLDRFRPCPCAVLLATEDLAAAREAHPLAAPTEWPDGRVARFESELLGRRLGVVERNRAGIRERASRSAGG
jgi:hypothetical protein